MHRLRQAALLLPLAFAVIVAAVMTVPGCLRTAPRRPFSSGVVRRQALYRRCAPGL
jgi:hypothetical protein